MVLELVAGKLKPASMGQYCKLLMFSLYACVCAYCARRCAGKYEGIMNQGDEVQQYKGK